MHVEARVISPSNTIIDPWTVVIVALHTLVTDVTVPALGQANDLAEGTERLWVESFHQLDKFDFAAALDVGGFGQPDGGEDEQIRN